MLAVEGLVLTIDLSKIWQGKRGKSGSTRSNAKSYPRKLSYFGAQPNLETVESGVSIRGLREWQVGLPDNWFRRSGSGCALVRDRSLQLYMYPDLGPHFRDYRMIIGTDKVK